MRPDQNRERQTKFVVSNRHAPSYPEGMENQWFQSVLACPICGSEQVIIRFKGAKRGVGHIKDLYCRVCKRTTKHSEAGEMGERALADLDEEVNGPLSVQARRTFINRS